MENVLPKLKNTITIHMFYKLNVCTINIITMYCIYLMNCIISRNFSVVNIDFINTDIFGYV